MKIKKINESYHSQYNHFSNIRSNILDMPNGDILYVAYKDGNMIAGGATNTGIIPEHVMPYDDSLSVDENLQNFYDYILYSQDINPIEEGMQDAFKQDTYDFKLSRKKNEYDEYVIKAYKNGRYNEDATYYTDDWEDAVGTLNAIANEVGLQVVPAYGGKGFVTQPSEQTENLVVDRIFRDMHEDAFDQATIYKDPKNHTSLLKADDGYAVVTSKDEWVGTVEAKDDKDAISKFEKGEIKNK